MQPKKDIFDVNENQLVAEIPNSNIKLYYMKKDEGLYRGFILQFNEAKRFFDWKNETTPAFAPQLILSDLDKDGKEELIILLTKGHGSGYLSGDVHVMKQDRFFSEILVENPFIVLYKNVRFKELSHHFEITFNDKKYLYNKREVLSPYSEGVLGWGTDVAQYEVKDNSLYARVSIYAPFIKYLGEFILKYKYEDDIFQKESIEYIDRWNKSKEKH